LQEAVFKKEVEHLSKKSRKNTLKVEKGFYTKENMRKVLGWNAKLVGIILCSTVQHVLFSPMLQLCVLLIPFSLPFLSVSLCTQEANQGCGQVLHCEVKGENACEALGFGAQYLYI